MDYKQQIKDAKNMGELFDIANRIDNKEEAEQFFDTYVDFIMMANQNGNREDAVTIAHSNLGYFAGYYDNKTREKIYNLFGSPHPIFGTSVPTPEEAFELGKQLGEKAK